MARANGGDRRLEQRPRADPRRAQGRQLHGPGGALHPARRELPRRPRSWSTSRPTRAPARRSRPTFRNFKAPKGADRRKQRRRAVDRQQLRDRRDDVPGLPLDLQGHVAATARRTWSDVSANAASGCPQGSTQSLDPILYTDRTTGRTFESQLTGVDSFTCYTDDDGKTWPPSTGGGIPSGVDHQTLGGGPFTKGGLGSLPTTDYQHAVYYCSQDIATAFCAASHDGGTTFGAGVPTYDLTQCGGLHGHVKVGPDGTAYLPEQGLRQARRRRRLRATTARAGPSIRCRRARAGDSDPSVGIGANGTVYFGYVGADGRPGVAVSTDHGKTWKHGQQVGGNLGVKNAVFPAMVAGSDDRAAFAYLGTTTGGDYQNADEVPRRLAPLHQHHLRRRPALGDPRRDAERPGAARLALHRRHHLRQRPQPARLHGRHARRARPDPGRLRRRLHRQVRATDPQEERPRRLRHHRAADAAAGRSSRSTTE